MSFCSRIQFPRPSVSLETLKKRNGRKFHSTEQKAGCQYGNGKGNRFHSTEQKAGFSAETDKTYGPSAESLWLTFLDVKPCEQSEQTDGFRQRTLSENSNPASILSDYDPMPTISEESEDEVVAYFFELMQSGGCYWDDDDYEFDGGRYGDGQ